MWLCYKVMATRSLPCVPESRVRGLDVGAELKGHLVRNWEVSGRMAAWQREEHRPWRARHGPRGREGWASLPWWARGRCQRAASQRNQSSKLLSPCKMVWVKKGFSGSWPGMARPHSVPTGPGLCLWCRQGGGMGTRGVHTAPSWLLPF